MQKFLDLIKKIASKKFVLVIISLLLGIVGWLLVMDATNPVVEMTVSVDISFENFNAPAQKQLTLVSDLGVVNAEVKVSGRQNLLNKLLPSDFYVKADFSSIENTGSSYLKVEQPVCSKMGVKTVDYYPKEIAVSYDRKTEMYLPVRLDFSESILKAGYEIISVTSEPDSVPISGFATQLENLEYISVNLSENVGDNSVESDRTITFIGRYMTSSGDDVTANFDTEKVVVRIDVAKRVPVIYTLKGEPGDDCYFISDTASMTNVLIDGNSTDLVRLKAIDLGTVDITGATESFTKTFALSDFMSAQLYTVDPDQIDEKVTVSVEIGHYETRVFKIGFDDVTQAGRDDETYLYTISFADEILDEEGNLVVTVKGKAEQLDKIRAATLKPTIELPNEGIYRNRNILFEVPEGVELVGDYLYDIIVQFVPRPTEAPTPVPTPVPTEIPTEVPTEAPTETPPETEEPTEEPTETPPATDEPTATPEETENPQETEEPTETPAEPGEPTDEPGA
ncbi:MAG: hypothetical protein II739_07620 [Clostridia bacterium]|nr:hypothetical protein [Clostridia bacterium]